MMKRLDDPDALKAVHQVTEMRGWVVGSFGQIEFLLAYLIERSAIKWPVYEPYAKTLPYGVNKRASRVKAMLKTAGPLDEHSTEIRKIIRDLLSVEDFRHMMAHGFTQIIKAQNGYFARFRHYAPAKGDTWRSIETTFNIKDLREQTETAVSIASSSVGYFSAIFLRHGLETDLGNKRGPGDG